jgi:hypothetical protein
LGQLTIDDATRVHGIQVPTRDGTWKWRLYFPSGRKYRLHCYTGSIPAGVAPAQQRDFQSLNSGTEGSAMSFAGVFDGEQTIEARLKPTEGEWRLEISVGGRGWSYLRLDKDFAQYLSTPPGNVFLNSNLKLKEQTVFAPDERIFLLKVRKLEVTTMPGVGTAVGEANGPAPGVAMWIE